MPDALLLLPDFTLIVIGWFLCRHTPLDRSVWDGVERLVYYLLFPALLFSAILRYPLQPQAAAALAACGMGVVVLGVTLAYALKLWPGVDAMLHASGAQVAFRFNSYVALALAERLAGIQGVAWVALLVALCVPLCNIAAVWPLARHGGHGFWRELAKNPLIISTAAGLVCNLLGLKLPDLATTTLVRIGAAALPLGLMAVGAGLGDRGLAAGVLAGLGHREAAVLAVLLAAGGVALGAGPQVAQPALRVGVGLDAGGSRQHRGREEGSEHGRGRV